MLHSCQGKNQIHALLLACNGINHRLAVINPQASLKCRRIRCVNLERQRERSLKARDSFRHDCRFIDPRKSYIDIQNLRTSLFLFNSLLQDIVKILLFKCFLQFLLPCRVNTFSDQNRLLSEKYGLRKGRHRCSVFLHRSCERQVPRFFDFFPDIFRRRPAASAENMDPKCRNRNHFIRKLICRQIIHCFPVFCPRDTCIRVYNDRE